MRAGPHGYLSVPNLDTRISKNEAALGVPIFFGISHGFESGIEMALLFLQMR